jgi:hypothetical protein
MLRYEPLKAVQFLNEVQRSEFPVHIAAEISGRMSERSRPCMANGTR